ncbi:MAG: glycosyltransferase family 2 protein [Bacteroidia bacterium]|nr:glycosyltransferase family 2 protein [Bacteroidia bacterium]
MSKLKVAVVILNFNGRKFLEKFLPNVISHSQPHEVIVADNASSDDSIAFLKQNYPSLRVIQTGGNFGYAEGYNKALKQVNAEYFILLNSDVEVSENWIDPLLNLMDSDISIAACQPKIIDYAKRDTFEYAGASGGFLDKYGYPFCRGRIFNSLEKDHSQYNNATEVFWATGACLFVRASAFNQIGGFDGRYFAHMEEIDLCWRLKNFGYKIFVEPKSVVYHIGGGTLNKLSRQKTYLNFRNNLATFTKNHPSRLLLSKVFYRMILDGVAAFKFLLSGQAKHFFAVIHAHFTFYTWLPSILRERDSLKKQKNFRYNFTNVYNGNIVWEHYVKGLKKFSDLKKPFF